MEYCIPSFSDVFSIFYSTMTSTLTFDPKIQRFICPKMHYEAVGLMKNLANTFHDIVLTCSGHTRLPTDLPNTNLRRMHQRCTEFATSSWQLQTGSVEKLKTEHVESSWVVSGGVCVLTRRQSWSSLQFCSQLELINSQRVQFSGCRPNPSWTSCKSNTQ